MLKATQVKQANFNRSMKKPINILRKFELCCNRYAVLQSGTCSTCLIGVCYVTWRQSIVFISFRWNGQGHSSLLVETAHKVLSDASIAIAY